ncbi:hypothetical protein [Mesorhizobium sp.]|uniref:hypothetical protein n=2 Tax=Mesorhizobium sp. TaxID=1871066 RepID=UPI0012220D8B|nr:hypothetical protein [Mesorhizobium sp.]TIM38077.1 MAG: hypothetical protein E5Y56_31190 [Mesorhizobium sp.]
MDARRTTNPDELVLSLSLSEAHDINQLVDNFLHWELIGDRENKEPMMFMLQFGRDCGYAVEGFPTMAYAVERGQVPLSRAQLVTISAFLKVCVERDGHGMSWLRRKHLDMAWKTLRNRVVG